MRGGPYGVPRASESSSAAHQFHRSIRLSFSSHWEVSVCPVARTRSWNAFPLNFGDCCFRSLGPRGVTKWHFLQTLFPQPPYPWTELIPGRKSLPIPSVLTSKPFLQSWSWQLLIGDGGEVPSNFWDGAGGGLGTDGSPAEDALKSSPPCHLLPPCELCH